MRIATMIAVLKENCDCSSHKMPYFLVFVRTATMIAVLQNALFLSQSS